MLSSAMMAGMMFAVCWWVLIDGIAISKGDKNPEFHLHFVEVTPAIFSTLAFFVLNVTSPSDLFPDMQPKAQAFFVLGWLVMFSSNIAALVLCARHYTGLSTRESAWPGIALVFFTMMMPLAASALWSSKSAMGGMDTGNGNEDDDSW